MMRRILRQLLYAVGLILAVLVLNFLLIQLAPGDPAQVIAGEMGGASPEVMAAIRQQYGLDKPVLTQLALYLGRALQGDLGMSYFYNRPVVELILSRLGPTLLLVAAALAFAVLAGTRLGLMAAKNPRGIASGVVTVLSLVGYSAPVFWTGLMLVILFGAKIPLFPIAGMIDVVKVGGPLTRALDIAHHLVLPALTLGLVYLAQYSRLTRASMLEVLGADYIRTARAKGVSERQVLGRHAFRNALLPVVTVAGMQFGAIISGAVLVETVFSWPGLGTLAFQAILARDYPTVLGILFFSTLIVIIANLLTDFVSRLLDPRLAGGR
ncbi:ABC transporter permease [Paracoccus sp. CPCC 101403]|uniref:ABC transporter permease n=1 Tax=Paracoccus broussonetiae TaxID=3075834 RepID=A0ABU3EB83_9RHOB|nr:ABC transporter permease [Paracoccus sp. CPCC 101403]MDT1060740.1 ABC transporter permease [Paracoccus sp. CPCC 101403]